MEQSKEEPKVVEVPVFITEEDIKRMIYVIFMRIANIETKIDELVKIAKEQNGAVQ